MERKIHFNLEVPSDTDLFSGNGHISSARAIKQALEQQDNLNIIGLEGDLGAGKSSIIKMLESLLDKKYKFIYFDISTYYHSSFKSEFIKFFSSALKDSFKEKINHKSIDEYANKALGRTFSYEKETKSNISWWVFSFAISIVFSVRYFNDSIKILLDTLEMIFGSDKYAPTVRDTITCALGLSPFLIAFGNYIRAQKNKNLKFSLGDLLKKNSTDTITETLLINKEVGSYELKQTFCDMLGEVPKESVVILVLDNIDRVEKDSLGEIWGDIDIFSNIKTGQLKIIIPFSERHVSKALNKDDPEEGKEYISKKLPVVFKAPPVVTANWRDLFDMCWKDSINGYDGLEQCKNLIGIWLTPGNQITPRLIKRHINDIAAILACNPSLTNAATSAAYLLCCKNHGIDITTLLSDPNKLDDSVENSNSYANKIGATHKVLDKLKVKDDWVSELACIHYQTTIDVARSELLEEPIRNGFTNNTPADIISLSDVYGYNIVLEKIADDIGFIDCIKICGLALKQSSSNVEWAREWVGKFNTLSDSSSPLIKMDIEFIESILALQEKNIEARLDSVLSFQKSLECIKEPLSEASIKDLYYCTTVLKNKTPQIISNPTSDTLIMLWKYRDIFAIWNVKELAISNDTFISSLDILLSQDELDFSFMRWGIKTFTLTNKPPYEKIENAEKISISIEDDLIDEDKLMCLPYLKDWYSTAYASELAELIDDAAFDSIKDLELEDRTNINSIHTAIIMAHIITTERHEQEHSFYNSQTSSMTTGSSTELFDEMLSRETSTLHSKYLSELLVFIPRFAVLHSALTSEHSKFYEDAIRLFINSKKYNALDIKPIVHGAYDVYRRILNIQEASDFINNLFRWSSHYIKTVEIQKWSTAFISDALSFSREEWGKIFEDNFKKSSVQNSFWLKQLDSSDEYVNTYLAWLVDNNEKIKNQQDVMSAIKALYENVTSLKDSDYDKKIIIGKIINLLEQDNINTLTRHFSNRILQPPVSTVEKIALIIHFGDIIELKNSEQSDVHESYMHLIEYTTDERVLTWLSKQDFKLSQWSDKNLIELAKILSRPVINSSLSTLHQKAISLCNKRKLRLLEENEHENGELGKQNSEVEQDERESSTIL
ncbi:MAG: P-loop NTPase fold protein [Aeromonas veronii]